MAQKDYFYNKKQNDYVYWKKFGSGFAFTASHARHLVSYFS